MITTDDVLAILKMARVDNMNYTSSRAGFPASNSGLADVRAGDLVRKEYTAPLPPKIRAVEYEARHDRDSYGSSSGTYTVLKRHNPLEGLGIGAVVEVTTDTRNVVTLVKVGSERYHEVGTCGAVSADTVRNSGAIKVLSQGYKPEK